MGKAQTGRMRSVLSFCKMAENIRFSTGLIGAGAFSPRRRNDTPPHGCGQVSCPPNERSGPLPEARAGDCITAGAGLTICDGANLLRCGDGLILVRQFKQNRGHHRIATIIGQASKSNGCSVVESDCCGRELEVRHTLYMEHIVSSVNILLNQLVKRLYQ
jgi:hypothetical protein